MRIAVVSDTHGLLRPELLDALRGADYILHAGDVGGEYLLDRLRKIAPVTAIRGNIDTHGPCASLPATEMLELGGRYFYLVHSLAELDLNPKDAAVDAVISGHSHQALVEMRENVLYFNPGSAGPRRFRLPVTFGWLQLEGSRMTPEIVHLPRQEKAEIT